MHREMDYKSKKITQKPEGQQKVYIRYIRFSEPMKISKCWKICLSTNLSTLNPKTGKHVQSRSKSLRLGPIKLSHFLPFVVK